MLNALSFDLSARSLPAGRQAGMTDLSQEVICDTCYFRVFLE
jgi:hypothetical protein